MFLFGAAAATIAPAGFARAYAGRLPDGEVSRFGGVRAWLTGPTTRYAHAVLGDAIEAEGFMVEQGVRRLDFRLGSDAVFEDRRVRLIDIDGDGRPEALVVKAYLDRGAALALYRLGENGITPLAESTAIGQRHRWLNPVGVSDFLSDGTRTIAAVVTPHLAGSLRLYRLAGSMLAEVARIDGFTNHIIGSRDLDLGRVVTSADGRSLIAIPALDRRSIAFISFTGGQAQITARRTLSARVVTLAAHAGMRLTATLEDGSTVTVTA